MPAPRTIPESSGFRRTSSHAEVLAFLDAVDAARDPRVVRTTFGVTPEGRQLPLVIVADPPIRDAAAALASGKPRVLVMANIHAGEVEGKEACLELLREIVWGTGGADGEPYPVSDVVLLLAPIYNADGNERVRPPDRESRTARRSSVSATTRRPRPEPRLPQARERPRRGRSSR